jgi:hypothetical protein
MKLKTNFREFTIGADFKGEKVSPWDKNNFNHYVVKVKNNDNNKKTSFDFWVGDRLGKNYFNSDYELLNAFYTFCSDGLSSLDGFENFCSEFGYDTDSRRAEKTFKACKRLANKFFNLTGYSADMFYDLVNDLSEIAS